MTIPIPEGFGKNLVVYHEEQEGKLEDMKAAVNDNGTVSFTASRFSPSILADLGEHGGNTGGGAGGNTENTGNGNGGNTGNGTGENTGNSGGGTGGNTGASGNGENVSGADAGGSTAGRAPKTGDVSSMTLCLILALAALGSMGVLGKRKLNG